MTFFLDKVDPACTGLSGIDREMYLWKQAPEKWCLLEIVGQPV